MIKLNFLIKDKSWSRRLKKIKFIVKKIIKQKNQLKFNKNIDYYLNIVLMNDKEMKKLNLKYKKINKTTDVLTFITKHKNQRDKIIKYCDVIISSEMVKLYSQKNCLNFYDHLSHLFVHSFLHINGFLHKQKDDYKKMKNIEIKKLKKIGLQNPYLY